MSKNVITALIAFVQLAGFALPGPARAAGSRPWLDAHLSPGRRAALAVRAMNQAEKLRLVYGYFGSVMPGTDYVVPHGARMGSAGYVPGVARLGIPPEWETDAGLGVATQRASTDAYRERTALPSGLATAASWNPRMAERGGEMIAKEARASGFNVLLGPGADLVREVRGGRDFEYVSEDPLLTGVMAGAEIRGIQSEHVIAVLKHFAFNDQETGRTVYDVRIGQAVARETDLLGFELAIEQGHPGALMCAYNRTRGQYNCENRWLLHTVLDGDWGYPGYVMSDWGAVHSTVRSALAGLDQESATIFDRHPYYGPALVRALRDGRVPEGVLDQMAERILRSMLAVGLVEHPIDPAAHIDFAADRAVAEADEQQGIVLLKNAGGVLPLSRTVQRIAVIGGYANRGVIDGGGSSTVFPVGGNVVRGLGPKEFPGPEVYLPSAPLGAMMGQAPQSRFRYASGRNLAHALQIAKWADRVVVFVTQWAAESIDVPLSLGAQDGLVEAVARANPHTVVVIESGGPVLMPWLGQVAGVIETWFPGSGGGTAIARVLFGVADPSGHLPVSFPATEQQLPFRRASGSAMAAGAPFVVDYSREGTAAGYKWYQARGLKPLFPFGFGLSYTHFAFRGLNATLEHGRLVVHFSVRNRGQRTGAAVAQVYVSAPAGLWAAPRRLAGWRRVKLAPGAERTLTVTVDPRLLAVFDTAHQHWVRKPGTYTLWLGDSSAHLVRSVRIRLPAWQHPARWPVDDGARD